MLIDAVVKALSEVASLIVRNMDTILNVSVLLILFVALYRPAKCVYYRHKKLREPEYCRRIYRS